MIRRPFAALTLCAGLALPQASAACAQLSAHVWMCDRGTAWETATWDVVGDGATRYLGDVTLNFTEEWPGFDITDGSSTLEEQYTTYSEWIAAEGEAPLEVLDVDTIDTPQGQTLRHIQYDKIDGARILSAVMLSEIGSARIMLYLDTPDTVPLDEIRQMSRDVVMMLRDTCADAVSCAETYEPPKRDTD